MKYLLVSQQILNEMEEAGAETQPALITACKQPPESKIIQKCLIP